jgi:hypothetical protein
MNRCGIAETLDEIARKLRAGGYFGGLPGGEFGDRAAGHDLDFSVISKERRITASIAAHDQNDLGPMRRPFAHAIDPARRAALRDAIGVGGAHFMARTQSQILIGTQSGPTSRSTRMPAPATKPVDRGMTATPEAD